jgi:hypothetical protein
MNEQKEREAFEKWYAAEYLMPPGAFRQVEGTYEKGFVKDGWEAWEARAKLEPQLPIDAITSAIHALERSKIGVEYRETIAMYDSHIDSLRALLPPSPNEEPKA